MNRLIIFFGILALARGTAVPEQVHLSLGKLQSQMAVTWTTLQPVVSPGPSSVRYGTHGGDLIFTSIAETTNFTYNGVSRYIHRAVMNGLADKTSYDYQVGSSDGFSQVFTFTTLASQPSPGNPIRICIFGDLGVENGVTLPYLVAAAARGEFDLVLHIGDIAYDLQSDNGAVGDKFLNEIQPIAASIPYMVLAGNHEEDGLNFTNFKERFTMPSDLNDASIYSFDVGPIHFTSVSTEYYGYFYEYGQQVVINQHAWLEADLVKANVNRAQHPFFIALQHRPFYCSNENSYECKSFENTLVRVGYEDMPGLEQLYLRYNVDLGFWGHEHSYERFFPIADRKYWATNNPGVYYNTPAPTYITTGAAGCYSGIAWYGTPNPASVIRNEHYGYMLLTVYNNTHLHLQQTSVNTTTSLVDEFWYVKESASRSEHKEFELGAIPFPEPPADYFSSSFQCNGEKKEECLALSKALGATTKNTVT